MKKEKLLPSLAFPHLLQPAEESLVMADMFRCSSEHQ